MELEVNREKDINNILMTQIKTIKSNPVAKTPATPQQIPLPHRDSRRSVSASSIQIDGEYIDHTDFCEKEFRNGPGKCTNEECVERHDIDFTKKGVCMYEYAKVGSCKRGESCWFTHQVPRWYRTATDTVNYMKTKSERLKNKTRVVMNSQKPMPQIWQNNSHPNGILPRQNYQSASMNWSNESFLEMANKIVEETINKHHR